MSALYIFGYVEYIAKGCGIFSLRLTYHLCMAGNRFSDLVQINDLSYRGLPYIFKVNPIPCGGGVRTDPPSALSAAILWGMHQPIPNFLTFPNLIPTFIW